MKNTHEEFFYSEDPQEIERERKKKDSLLKLFPSLFSNPKDTTQYIPIKQDTIPPCRQQDCSRDKSNKQITKF